MFDWFKKKAAPSDATADGPEARLPVKMYLEYLCPYCIRARELLDAEGVAYEMVDVEEDPEARVRMKEAVGSRKVPQIWVGDRHIGGFEELRKLHRRGQLEKVLRGMAPK